MIYINWWVVLVSFSWAWKLMKEMTVVENEEAKFGLLKGEMMV